MSYRLANRRKARFGRLGDGSTPGFSTFSSVPWYYWLFPGLGQSQEITNYEMAINTPPVTASLPGASWVDAVTGLPILTGQPSQTEIQNIASQGSSDVIGAGGGPSAISQLQQDINAEIAGTGGTRTSFAQLVSGSGSSLLQNEDPSTLILWAVVGIVGFYVAVELLK